jgi:hypothetical protein
MSQRSNLVQRPLALSNLIRFFRASKHKLRKRQKGTWGVLKGGCNFCVGVVLMEVLATASPNQQHQAKLILTISLSYNEMLSHP